MPCLRRRLPIATIFRARASRGDELPPGSPFHFDWSGTKASKAAAARADHAGRDVRTDAPRDRLWVKGAIKQTPILRR